MNLLILTSQIFNCQKGKNTLSIKGPDNSGISYKDAGVDIAAGSELIDRIKPFVQATHKNNNPPLSGLGGFASLTQIPNGYLNPVLVSGTDGVGTKLELANKYDRHQTIGQDLVAMCVNDVLVCGGEPLFFLDYFATGKLDIDLATKVIKGIADGCQLAGCSLAGGETAEMPGFYHGSQYDLAGFCVGVVERDKIIDGSKVKLGNKIIGLPSSGPHSNGFSLIRKILETTELKNEQLVSEMMNPTRIYVKSVLSLIEKIAVKGMVHVTGGGFYENIRRVLPDRSHAALIDTTAWQRPDFFSWLQDSGNITEREMLTTFNCGIGYLLIVDENDIEGAIEILQKENENPLVLGEIVESGRTTNPSEILI